RRGCVVRLYFCGELREVTAHDRLAEAQLELLFPAGDFIQAAGLEVLAPEAPADTHGQVGAVAALLPWAQRDARRDLLRSWRGDVRDFEPGKPRHRGTFVDAPVRIDRVVVFPVQLAGAEQRLERLVLADALDSEPALFDALVELHEDLGLVLLTASGATRFALLRVDDRLEVHAGELPAQAGRLDAIE